MSGLAPWPIWLVVGVGLLIAEVLVPGVFLMWLGIAAIGTGLLTRAAGLEVGLEVVSFAVLAAVSLAVGLRVRRRPAPPVLNTPEAGLVGRHAVALDFVGARGRVRVGDADWGARLASGVSCRSGEVLRVTGVEGMTLVVEQDQ